MIECREVDAKIYSAWTEGRIVLRNVTLEELMNRISRWYDLRINWYDEEIKITISQGKCYDMKNSRKS